MDMALADFEEAPPANTTITSTPSGPIATTNNPPVCSNSRGEIPANRPHRPVSPRPPEGSQDYIDWYTQGWWVNNKGDHTCRMAAYEADVHCSYKYSRLATAPGNLVCGDFHDCATAPNGKSDCTFIEFDSANSCAPRFIGCRGEKGCLTAEAKVQISDGTTRPISRLRVGDAVFNPLTKKHHKVIRVIEGPEKEPLMRIELANPKGAIVLTRDHPVMTNLGRTTAERLKRFHKIVDANLKERPIKRIIMHHGYSDYVWNIELAGTKDKDHYFIADGVISGDLYLQESPSPALANSVKQQNSAEL